LLEHGEPTIACSGIELAIGDRGGERGFSIGGQRTEPLTPGIEHARIGAPLELERQRRALRRRRQSGNLGWHERLRHQARKLKHRERARNVKQP